MGGLSRKDMCEEQKLIRAPTLNRESITEMRGAYLDLKIYAYPKLVYPL